MSVDLAYLAGLVDGEGSVGFFSERAGKKVFTIEIKMTSEPLIDWIVSNFGGTKAFRKSKVASWQDQWRWKIRGVAAAQLYIALNPYLKLKRL